MFRDYSDQPEIKKLYEGQRKNQTVEYVKRMRNDWTNFRFRVFNEDRNLTIMEAMDKLDSFVDSSDPDIGIGNTYHMYQTAEQLRKNGEPDWLQLVGFIHDLGKVMYFWGKDEDGTSKESQYGVVGDTFIVGCKIPDESVVFPELNKLNPDMSDRKYSSKLGMYFKGCGLDNCLMSWGHDEYLYQVLKFNGCTIPDEGLKIIRYHSLYPWHSHGAYKYFENDDDRDCKELIQRFQKADLYTKTDDFDEKELPFLREYYTQLIEKYIGLHKLVW